jgi:hypothetical protein
VSGSRLSLASAAVAAAGALAFAAACKSSTSTNACGSGTPPAIAGTYSLESYDIGGTLITAPPASGQLRLNANKTYGVNLTLPAPTGAVADSGTYAIQGASCISQSSVLGQPQFVGTFTLTGTTLTVSGTAGGQAAASVWTKTS